MLKSIKSFLCVKHKLYIFFIVCTSVLITNFVHAQKTIRVGVYQNPPKIFTNEQGKPDGFFIEILNHIATKENWKLIYINGTWDECINRIDSSEIDVMPDVAYSKIRNEKYDFNKECLLTNWSTIYINKKTKLNTIFDLEGKKVAYVRGDIAFYRLTEMLENYVVSCNYIEVDNFEDAIKLIDEEKVDAGVISRLIGQLNENKYKIYPTHIRLSPYQLFYATQKGKNQDILTTIDKNCVRLKKDKSSLYYKALNKWILPYDKVKFPVWLKLSLYVLSFLIVIAISFIYILRRLVKKRTLELEKAKTNAEESDKLKTAFLENMSHEIRTPMNAIMGFSQLLNNQDLDVNSKNEFVKIINYHGYELTSRIDSIITLSKIYSKNIIIKKTQCDINALFNELVKESHSKYNNNELQNIQLITKLPNKEIYINTDAYRLKQILSNLIDNSIKFTKQGTIEIGYYKENSDLVLFIKDTGIGIDEKNQTMIFERFRKIDEDKTILYRGIGIGLTISNELARLLGAKFSLKSKLKSGSTFYLKFTL